MVGRVGGGGWGGGGGGVCFFFFFFNDTATTEIYTLSLHDALPIYVVFHRSHIKTLEESFQRREARLQDETELLITQHNEKLRMLDTEKSDIQTSNMRKITMLETSKEAEVERLKELHRKTIDVMRQEHEEEVAHLRKLKVLISAFLVSLMGLAFLKSFPSSICSSFLFQVFKFSSFIVVLFSNINMIFLLIRK